MGWDAHLFVSGQDLESFGCTICQEILCDPVSIGCSSDHLFCRECLQDFAQSSCPLCRAEVRMDQRRASTFVKRLLDRLRVRCGADKSGKCTWVGPLGDGHDKVCERREVSCSNKTRRETCSWRGSWTLQAEHAQTCPLATVLCPRSTCATSVVRRDLPAHDGICEGFQCPFLDEDGCPFVGRQAALSVHVVYCLKLHLEIKQLRTRFEDSEGQRLTLEARLATIPASHRETAIPTETIISPSALDSGSKLHEMSDDETPRNASGASSLPVPTAFKTQESAHVPIAPPPPPTPAAPPTETSRIIQHPMRKFDATVRSRNLPFSTHSTSSVLATSFSTSASTPNPAAGPFNLTGPAAPRRPRTPPIPSVTLESPIPFPSFALTKPCKPTVRAPDSHAPLKPRSSAPFDLTSMRPTSQRRSREESEEDDDEETDPLGDRGSDEDEEDDLGRWETTNGKRPRFDGGFPKEWEV